MAKAKGQKNLNDCAALQDIDHSGDPLAWLVNLYPYKLPQPYNEVIQLVTIEAKEEMNSFLVHHYMLNDGWMTERCLVPCPKTRRLGDLAALGVSTKYFETDRPDTQVQIFKEWKQKSSLEGLIEKHGRPLVELTWPNEYEIVDGWGRLMTMSAMLKSGLSFHPFECFVARRQKIEQAGGHEPPTRCESKAQ